MSTAEPTTPTLCRIALLIGADFEVDYSLPAGVALIAVTEDLVARVNEVLRERGREPLDAEHSYRLCRADAQPLDPQKTLDECGVLDGDQLWLLPAHATETYEPVTEMVSTAVARTAAELLSTLTADVGRKVASWLTAGIVGWACLIVVNWWWSIGGTDEPWGWVGATSAWALLAVVVASARGLSKTRGDTDAARQRRATGHALSWIAVIPAAAAAAMSLPGTPGLWHLVAAAVAASVGVIVLAMLWGRHVTAIVAMLTVSVFALPTAIIAASTWQVRPEHVAVVALGVVIAAVLWAAPTATFASGASTPRFPSVTNRGVFEQLPGQPADTVSPVGPTGVATRERLRTWVLRGNDTLTGIMLGLAVVAVVATRYAVVPGQPGGWRYTVYVAAMAVLLVLLSRAFVDRYQAVTLLVAGVGAAALAIGRFAASDATSLTVALVGAGTTLGIAVMGLVMALVVPFRDYAPPIRRFIQLVEYALILVVWPWAVWLLGILPVIRNAVRHGI